MKATLEFNLPDDNEEYKLANMATDFYCALYRFSEDMRSLIKYRADRYDPDTLEKVRSLFYEILEMYNINLDAIV